MTIQFNGTELEEVKFNGVDCEKVYFNGVLVFEKASGVVSGTITVAASPYNSWDYYDYGFSGQEGGQGAGAQPFGAVSDKDIDGRGQITWLSWSTFLESGVWSQFIVLNIEQGTDLDLVTAAKVTINNTVFTLDVYDSSSSHTYLECVITEEQFNALPKSGTHSLKLEVIP